MDAINEFTKQHGYALTTKSSKRHEGDGQIKARYLHCNRSGVYKNNIADCDGLVTLVAYHVRCGCLLCCFVDKYGVTSFLPSSC